MKDELIFYLVYRVYKYDDYHDGPVLYGWTNSKSVLKAFIKQRDQKKYQVYKRTEDELISEFSESMPADEIKIDYVKLQSVKTGDSILFFTTLNELQEAEKKIQRIFKDLSSLDRLTENKDSKGIMFYFTMFMNIKEEYADALYDIGYRPKEVDAMFDNINDDDEIDNTIEYAYSEGRYLTEWDSTDRTYLPGQMLMEDFPNQVIYSLESIIRVLQEDL
jgi:hypothetical protein